MNWWLNPWAALRDANLQMVSVEMLTIARETQIEALKKACASFQEQHAKLKDDVTVLHRNLSIAEQERGEARLEAARLLDANVGLEKASRHLQRSVGRLTDQVDELTAENNRLAPKAIEATSLKDVLERIRAANSARVSRGNRTRALRRRGALIPEIITENNGLQADHRTHHTG